jgi:hypothetical protein
VSGRSKIGQRVMASAAQRSREQRHFDMGGWKAVIHPTLDDYLRAEREERERAEARRDPRQRSLF